jgi:propanol-preferring alcohol dehydrogenase
MRFEAVGRPLREVEVPDPSPGPGQIGISISACGVCRTDLHVVDGELADPRIPVIPGHQIVGRVSALGPGVDRFSLGERVGVAWLGGSCGDCDYCRGGRENLCADALYTGYRIDGGFAERCVAAADFCFRLPDALPDQQAAPLLCAGLIGYRALRFAGDARHLGFYGFGSAAHILTQIAVHQSRTVYAFTRPGDVDAQRFATDLGAGWSGDSDTEPPRPLDAAIIFAPVGDLVPKALRAVARGGVVVCAGIHMSDIPSFPYADLWGERSIVSVANLTRRDGEEFFELIERAPIRTEVTTYPLGETNRALDDLRHGRFTGSAVVDVTR